MPEKLKYSLVMFLAGSFYGFVVPLVRTAQSAGFHTSDIMVTQYLIASASLALAVVVFSRKKVKPKDILKLMGVGLVAAGVSFTYYQSLERLSAATSLTLLFQFVWMGMVVQAIRTKTAPRPAAVLTVLMVAIGAVLATGMLDEGSMSQSLDPLGVVFGLVSAACYTAFLVLSSRTASALPAANRSMFTTFGSLLVALTLAFANPLEGSPEPLLIVDPLLSVALGVVGICLPVFLIALSSPKLPTGLTTVMASSELPSGVICAAIFLGEPVSFTMGLGVVIVLAGIVVSELESLRLFLRKPKKTV